MLFYIMHKLKHYQQKEESFDLTFSFENQIF